MRKTAPVRPGRGPSGLLKLPYSQWVHIRRTLTILSFSITS